MKTAQGIGLKQVQSVYAGAEGDLWELVMGQQIHIGGFVASMDLAQTAGLAPGMRGVDLCCCNGAGMRFLVRYAGAASMMGVDATEHVIERGIRRSEAEGMADRIHFTIADVCRTGLADAGADFVWGEDAWCYVEDKPALIREAARLVRRGGVIAFTDWVEGRNLSDAEAARYLAFMKFPSVVTLDEYRRYLEAAGCDVRVARDTGRFAPYARLYIDMVSMQLTGDALRIIGHDMDMLKAIAAELEFVRGLAEAGKIAQGMLIAVKE